MKKIIGLLLILIFALGFLHLCTNVFEEKIVVEVKMPTQEQLDSLRDSSHILKVGVGIEGIKDLPIEIIFAQANYMLKGYGIYLEVSEVKPMEIESSFSGSDLDEGVPHSFDRISDIYFVFIDTDLSNNGDISVVSCPRTRVALFDKDVKDGDWVLGVFNETLRMAKGESYSPYMLEQKLETASLSVVKSFLKKRSNQSAKKDYSHHLEKIRELKVGLIYDECSHESNYKFFQEAAKVFEKEFGVRLKADVYIDVDVPDSWNFNSLMEEYSRSFDSADIYVMMTREDYSRGDVSLGGQASSSQGIVWADVENHGVEYLVHEIAHLFGAKHDYLRGSVMAPEGPSGLKWSAKTRNQVLKEKFKTWELSK